MSSTPVNGLLSLASAWLTIWKQVCDVQFIIHLCDSSLTKAIIAFYRRIMLIRERRANEVEISSIVCLCFAHYNTI